MPFYCLFEFEIGICTITIISIVAFEFEIDILNQ